MNLLTLFQGSRTIGLALKLIPLLHKAYKASKADDWVMAQLKKRLPETATEAEMMALIVAARGFIQACWNFFHK